MSAPVRLQVWDETFDNLLATIVDLKGGSGQDELNEHGVGSLTLKAGNAALSYITHRRIIAVAHRNSVGTWVPAHAWVCEKPEQVLIDTDDGKALATTWTGRGILSLLTKSPVKARQPVPYAPLYRFDWANPNLDISTWSTPNVRSIQGLATAVPPSGWAGQPWSYPNPLAQFLWPTAAGGSPLHDVPGFAVFDNNFTLSQPERVHFYPIGDDTVRLAVDGVVIRQETDTSSTAMMETPYRVLDLPAGTHNVRVLVENVDRPAIPNNSGGMAIAIGREQIQTVFGDPHRVIDWLLTSSSSGWKSHFFTTVTPGFNVGQIFNELFTIANGRGEMPGWGFSFNVNNDSNIPGVPWVRLPGTSFTEGRDLYDIRGELVAEGWCDVAAGPDFMRLDAWPTRGTFKPAVVATGVNATALRKASDSSAEVTGLLVTWRDNSVIVGTGPRVGSMSSDAETLAEATRQGLAQLAQLGVTQTVTLAWIPSSDADTPFIGFNVGDTITGPTGILRVVSISWAIDGDRITWTVELATSATVALDRQAKINRRMSAGSLGGRSDLVAPTTPAQPDGGIVRSESISFQPPDGSAVGDTSPPETMSAPGVVHRARIFCTDASTSTGPTTFDLRINGAPSLWSFTLPTGVDEHWDTALVIVGDTNIKYTLRRATAGGHQGVNVEFIASILP